MNEHYSIKQSVIEMIEHMQDDASVEDVMAKLHFHCKVYDGLHQLDAGEGIEHEEARQRLKKWLD